MTASGMLEIVSMALILSCECGLDTVSLSGAIMHDRRLQPSAQSNGVVARRLVLLT